MIFLSNIEMEKHFIYFGLLGLTCEIGGDNLEKNKFKVESKTNLMLNDKINKKNSI